MKTKNFIICLPTGRKVDLLQKIKKNEPKTIKKINCF